MKHTVLIVDDERLARLALRRLLEERPDIEVVGEARSIQTAAEQLAELSPEIVFLDVEMPGGSGFDLFGLCDVRARVVFVTAYDDYAVRAFEVNALDYLVKPVQAEHIDRVLQRVDRPEVKPSPPTSALVGNDVVCLMEASAMKFARVSDITHIAAADDYTEVYLATGRMALVAVPLREWEERLPSDRFVRTHRSLLVNLHYVEEVTHADGRWLIRLRDVPSPLPMSRRFAQSLRKSLRVGV
jgi:two-component system LytT family response regulator